MSDVAPEVQIALLQKELRDLQSEVHNLSKSVDGLLDAWTTANGIVAFIKWMSGAIVGLGIIWTGLKIKAGL